MAILVGIIVIVFTEQHLVGTHGLWPRWVASARTRI